MSLFGDAESITDTDTGTGSSDLTCEVCGAAIQWSGRGRKPKYCDEHKTSRSTSSSSSRSAGTVPAKELEQACQNLMDTYESLLMPLMIFSPDAGNTWAAQIEKLDRQNHKFLANNRDLVKRINSAGSKAGTYGFVISHLAAVTPVMLVLYRDVNTIRTARAQARYAEPEPEYRDSVRVDDTSGDPVAGTPFDPDAAFKNVG